MDKTGVTITDREKKEIADGLSRFKTDMLIQFPFYGNFLANFPLIEDDNVKTACTNGKCIRYNPAFFLELSEEERNFVLLHEVMHIMLMHCIRGDETEKNPKVWNIAIDFVVNDTIYSQLDKFAARSIKIDCPSVGLFMKRARLHSADNIYMDLINQLKENDSFRATYYDKNEKLKSERFKPITVKLEDVDSDIIEAQLTDAERTIEETRIEKMLRDAIAENEMKVNGTRIPEVFLQLVDSKKLPWDKLLAEHLSDTMSDESSYMTPERKYLHMDLIVPGLGHEDDELEEVWAFLDSSGSINDNARNQFITQLYRIMKGFQAKVNIVYWNATVGKVYEDIQNPEKLVQQKPDATGYTDISCVYEYILKHKIDPTVMLVFTDGYFNQPTVIPDKKIIKKSIFVLADKRLQTCYKDIVSQLGTVTYL